MILSVRDQSRLYFVNPNPIPSKQIELGGESQGKPSPVGANPVIVGKRGRASLEVGPLLEV